MPLAGILVFSPKCNDTLQTNSEGIVNINIFPSNQPVVFALPPYFKTVSLTRHDLEKMHYVVYIERTSALNSLTPSKITAREYSEDLPFFVDIINLDDNSLLSPEENNENGKISVSLIDRGVTVFRTLEPKKMLLAIDGIPLNDEIHRNGKVEGLLNFDNAVTSRIQKIYGASFLIYGSDATGGVIHYFTKVPPSNKLNRYTISAISKFSSASDAFLNNLNFSYEGGTVSSFTSISYGKYGEIKMGKNRKYVPTADSLYGLNLYYVEHLTDTDVIATNPDPYSQKGTDYSQFYFFQKFRFNLNDNLNFFVNFHYVNTSELGIYSGLTEINYDHLRFAECKFMPQNKYILSLNLLMSGHRKFWDFVSLNSAYITYNEYRLTRKFNNPVELHQKERINVLDFHIDFVKLFNINRLVYGIFYSYNDLRSEAFFRNIYTDSTWQGLTRYPTHGAYSHTGAIYLGYRIMNPSYIFWDIGIRYNFRQVIANFDNNPPQLPLTFTKKEYFLHSPVFASDFNIFPFGWLQLKLENSYTIHFPIIDDFGKVMVKDFVVKIPTDNLLPEKSYNNALGFSLIPGDNFKIYASVFLNYTKDAIILRDTTLNGEDSLYFGTDRYNIATEVNVPEAVVYGVTGGIIYKYDFDMDGNIFVKFNSSVNVPEGKILNSDEYLPGVSPMFGNAGLSFGYYDLKIGLNSIFNGEKAYDQLSPVGEDYIEKASSEGFLPWQIYNFHSSYAFKYFELDFDVENIFDVFYRQYSTAIASPGRNFRITLKFKFTNK